MSRARLAWGRTSCSARPSAGPEPSVTAGILANVCESLIGAIFLDGGYEAARRFIETHWREMMLTTERPLRDPKTMLQEWAHKAGHGVPRYLVRSRLGPDHKPVFNVEVALEGLRAQVGSGHSKRAAEQAAAQAVLEAAGVWEPEGGDDE